MSNVYLWICKLEAVNLLIFLSLTIDSNANKRWQKPFEIKQKHIGKYETEQNTKYILIFSNSNY